MRATVEKRTVEKRTVEKRTVEKRIADYRITRFRYMLLALVFCLAVRTGVPMVAVAQESDVSHALAEPRRTPTTYQNPELVKKYQSSITAEDLAAHLYFFASDLFEGREATTHGQKLAANYLAGQYHKMGVEPRGTTHPDDPRNPTAYFQPFSVYGSRIGSTSLILTSGGSEIDSSIFSADEMDGSSFLAFGQGAAVTGPVTFAGYGIADSVLAFDDFAAMKAADIDYTGGWIMILSDEPLESAEKSLLNTPDGKPSEWSTSRFKKYQLLLNQGLPKGILLIGDSSPRSRTSVAEGARRAAAGLHGVGGLSLSPESGGGFNFPPVFTISSAFANSILRTSGRTVASIQQDVRQSLKPVVFQVPDVELSGSVTTDRYEATTENVVAFIEGSDPVLKTEVVVISSHYDHIGMFDAGEEDGINNGADDDGSGTVSVLEIAEAFAKARDDGNGPRRSILFLNVTGEEKGLLGSAFFADHEPIVPLDSIVTDLNIDMIGRIDPTHPGENSDYVYIIGSKLISQELHDINGSVNRLVGTNLDLNERFNSKDDPNRFFARSDHWNFGKHGIPFIFFFTGTHEDYHGVGDEPQKIEYERMSRIAQMIFATAWQVANQDKRPVVSGTGFN